MGTGCDVAAQGAHNAVGQGEGQLAEGIADGIDGVADAQFVGIADGDRLEILRLDFEDGDVVALVVADDLRVIGLVVKGRDSDGVGVLDDMVVCKDVPVLGDDEAGSCGLEGVAVTVTAVGLAAGGDTDGGIDILFIQIRRGELRGFGGRGRRAAHEDAACEYCDKKEQTQRLLKNRTGKNSGCFHLQRPLFVFFVFQLSADGDMFSCCAN